MFLFICAVQCVWVGLSEISREMHSIGSESDKIWLLLSFSRKLDVEMLFPDAFMVSCST